MKKISILILFISLYIDLKAQNTQAGNNLLAASVNDNFNGCVSSASSDALATSTSSGTITRDFWANITGTSIATVPVNTIPTSTTELTSFEGPSKVGDNYGSRIRGYIHAPLTGNYIFWIASDDKSELWLSANDNPANKVKIAFVSGYTSSRQWAKYTSQQSTIISLTAGQKYYIEAIHKEGSLGDNLAVGWQLPNGALERPIPGSRLSPFETVIPSPANQLISAGSSWKFLDNGTNQGTVWKTFSFNDATWKAGNAELGYGDGGEATIINYGPIASNKFVTTYFRKKFNVSNLSSISSLDLNIIRDDGAIVYINGVEIFRNNMPSGTVTYKTLASGTIGYPAETNFVTKTISPTFLVNGDNLIAVEIHQASAGSPDLSFNLKLIADTTFLACNFPSGIIIDSVDLGSAAFHWSGVVRSSYYKFQYRLAGSSIWDSLSTGINSINIYSLLSSSLYEFRIKTICSTGESGYSPVGTFKTKSFCEFPPLRLYSGSITSSSAILNWTQLGENVSYNLRFKKTGSFGFTTLTLPVNFFKLDSLLPETSYEFQVQNVCMDLISNYSESITFKTQPVSPAAVVNLDLYVNSLYRNISQHPFGININYLTDDDSFFNPDIPILSSLESLGVKMLRFPGGEKSDSYLWSVPPFETANPTLARTGANEWPAKEPLFVEPDFKTLKSHTLNFDEFIPICKSLGAEPLIVVSYDGMYKPATAGGIVPTKEQLLSTAENWVRYANIKNNYGVKYWMIGNESYHSTYNGSATKEQYTADLIEFSKRMKAVDPTIKIIANGSGTDWWQTVINGASSNIDYLGLSEYPVWQYSGGFEYYANNIPVLNQNVQDAANSISTYAPSSDKSRIKIIVAEFNSIDWSGEWEFSNDLGHALATFEIAGEIIKNSYVENACLWTTRFLPNWDNRDIYNALDENGKLNPNGMAMSIWGNNPGKKMVYISNTSKIRTFASYNPVLNRTYVYLINKDKFNSNVNLNVHDFIPSSVIKRWDLKGNGPYDKNPVWDQQNDITFSGSALNLTLPSVSITLLEFTGTLSSPSCIAPSGLTATSISSNSAILSWNAVTSAISYDVQYKKTGTSIWTTINTAESSKLITGLTPSTSYDYRVRSVCSDTMSDYPSISTFTTAIGFLIPEGSSWKYLDNGTDQGTIWRTGSFSDAAWKSGNAELGYGDGGEATLVSYGSSTLNKYITTYFRKTFNVNDKASISGLELSLLRDDGAVVYLNGTEVYRTNMPSGIINYNTFASVAIDGTSESTYCIATINSNSLVVGENTIAVEIHQQNTTSSDISFNLILKTLTTQPGLKYTQNIFAIIGDYGWTGPNEEAVANLVKSWSPEYIITTGDNNYRDGADSTIDANIGQYYHDYIKPYNGIYGSEADTNRFFPSLGNHDLITSSGTAYLEYFTLFGNERYYDFVKGDIHFFVLNGNPSEPDGITSTSVQANWLKNKLAASNAKWKLVYFHQSPFVSDLVHGNTVEMQWPFKVWGADAVISGHSHVYERIVIDNFNYFVNGLGGESKYSFSPSPISGSQIRYNANFGAMQVIVKPDTLLFKFYNVTNTLIESFPLVKSPSPPPVICEAKITAGGPTTFCAGGKVTLFANTGLGFAYQWKRNGVNISGATASSYTVSQAGDYQLKISFAGCTVWSALTKVTINTSLVAKINPGGTTTFCNGGNVILYANTCSGYIYQWKKNGVNISGATAAAYTANSSGDYQVKIIQGSSVAWSAITKVTVTTCTRDSDNVILHNDSLNISSQDANDTFNVNVYPNPSTGLFSFELSIEDIPLGSLLINVVNSLGQPVYTKTAENICGNIKETIELSSSLPAGIYILQLTIGKRTENTRVLLTR